MSVKVLTSQRKRASHLDISLQQRGGIPLSTASGLMAKPVICTFCKRPHSPNDCSVPMSVEARFHKVRVVKACFRSGRSGHRMAVCRHRKPCARGYYTLQLCKTGEVRVPDVTSPAPTRTQAIQAGILVSLPRTNHWHHDLNDLRQHRVQGTVEMDPSQLLV